MPYLTIAFGNLVHSFFAENVGFLCLEGKFQTRLGLCFWGSEEMRGIFESRRAVLFGVKLFSLFRLIDQI